MQVAEDVSDLPEESLENSPQNGQPEEEEEAPESFDFDAEEEADLTPKEIRGIKWKGKEYLLKRADEGANIIFTNARIAAARMDDGKLVALKGGGEVSALLVSLCLFEIGQRPKEAGGGELLKPVAEKTVRSWPPHIVNRLFEKAKKISHIDQPDKRTLEKQIEDLDKQRAKLVAQLEKERAKKEDLVGNS